MTITGLSTITGLGSIAFTDGLPQLTTTLLRNVSTTTATSGGVITNDGGSSVTARGVVWDTSTNPTTALSTKTSDSTGIGEFTSSLTSLSLGTLYYVRAYATNANATIYGNQLSFTTQNITYATHDPANKSTHIALTLGNLKATGDANAGSVKSTITFDMTKKLYVEFTVNTQGFSGSSFATGIGDATFNVSSGTGPGQDTHSYVCWDDGGKEFNNVFTAGYTANQTVGTIVSLVVDGPNGTITWWINGSTAGTAYSGITGTWYVIYYGDVFANAATVNFGATSFTYTPPSGFTGLYS